VRHAPPASARRVQPVVEGPPGRFPSGRRWLSPLVGLALLGGSAMVALSPPTQARNQVVADMAQLSFGAAEHVYSISPAMAVRLGSSGGNVVDLAVGDDALYTLDVVESSVRAFGLDGIDQQPTPDTLLVRAGAPIGSGQRRLAAPVAIQYLGGAKPDQGVLAIVDQARSVVQVAQDRGVSVRPVPSSAAWRELGALGGDSDGHLFVLDSGSQRLLQYPTLSQRLVDPPRLMLDSSSAPGLPFDKAAEIVAQPDDQVYLRMDDGTLRRFDGQGTELPFTVQAADGSSLLTTVSAITADRAGGLYLADPSRARILQTAADGTLLRQLRDPALGGVRQIQSSPDGRRLYGLVAAGVLVFDLPE
jgi:hypothetical protein